MTTRSSSAVARKQTEKPKKTKDTPPRACPLRFCGHVARTAKGATHHRNKHAGARLRADSLLAVQARHVDATTAASGTTVRSAPGKNVFPIVRLLTIGVLLAIGVVGFDVLMAGQRIRGALAETLLRTSTNSVRKVAIRTTMEMDLPEVEFLRVFSLTAPLLLTTNKRAGGRLVHKYEFTVSGLDVENRDGPFKNLGGMVRGRERG